LLLNRDAGIPRTRRDVKRHGAYALLI